MSLESSNYLELNGKRYFADDIRFIEKERDSLAEALRHEYNSNDRGAANEALKYALVYSVDGEDTLQTAERYRKFLMREDSETSNVPAE